jgi:hypothetical protein
MTTTTTMTTCALCARFSAKYRCNAPDECDCPKCQGLCTCVKPPAVIEFWQDPAGAGWFATDERGLMLSSLGYMSSLAMLDFAVVAEYPHAIVRQPTDYQHSCNSIDRGKAVALGLGVYQSTIYHRTLRNADGTALRARVNGECQTWKTRPTEFRLPMKHGLRNTFQLTERNAHEWSLVERRY